MNGVKWTRDEEEILKRVYPKYLLGEVSREDLLRLFPYRTFFAIQRRANNLGFNRVSKTLVNVEFYKELKRRIRL